MELGCQRRIVKMRISKCKTRAGGKGNMVGEK